MFEWLERAHNKAATERDIVEIHRAQGELRVLGAIIGMPQDIRDYLKDVAEGKRVVVMKEVAHG